MTHVIGQGLPLPRLFTDPAVVAGVAASGVVIAWLVWYLTGTVLSRLVASTETEVDDVVLETLRVPVTVSAVVAGGLVVTVTTSSESTLVFGARATLLSVLVVVWARALVGLGNGLIELVEAASDLHELVPIIENIWKFVVSLGGLFLLLSVWRVDVTPLLASASIAGVAVGFAARDTVANLFGGVALHRRGQGDCPGVVRKSEIFGITRIFDSRTT